MTRRRLLRASLVLGLGVALAALSLAWPLPEAARTGARASVRVDDRSGTMLREIRPDGRGPEVGLADVAPEAVHALVATEDRRFYSHPGVDVVALARAVVQNAKAKRVVSGGSTLTMQVARALRGRHTRATPADKIAEAHLALRLDARLSKGEILALWLNRVEFGNRAVGIEAAARTYFAKGARDLTASEAAYLVGLPQRPTAYDPFRHPERARARLATVLDALEAAGSVTEEDRQRLGGLPVPLVTPRAVFRAPHFVERVREAIPESAVEVRTTLDARLQRAAESIVRVHLTGLRDATVGAASVLILDNETGEILAYVGSPDFWDDRSGGQVDGVAALRQPGSALKPFTYALALESGRYTPATILADLELQVVEAGGAFSPENYDQRFHGPVPLREALASSFNVPAVRLAREMGPESVLRALRQAGFESLDQPASHYGVGLALGNGEVRMTEVARAYAGLARGGTLPTLRAVRWVRTASGDTLRPAPLPGTPMGVSPRTAHLLLEILSDPEARRRGFGRGGPLELPFPTAVKTGTSKDYRDNWAVGVTPRHTVAVWVGNFDGTPMRWVSGTRGAGPILNALVREVGDGGPFLAPEGLETATVCPASGMRPGAHCPTTRALTVATGSLPRDTCEVHVAVRVDRTTGLRADEGAPRDSTESRVYTLYPAEYHAWMRERGMRFPPTATPREASDSLTYSDRLRVAYPESGTAFFIDPILHRRFQRARFRASADPDLLGLEWYVNGRRLASDADGLDWPLEPGRHTVEVRGLTPDGQRLRSRPSRITVRAVPTEP